jgi:hypothetical protein
MDELALTTCPIPVTFRAISGNSIEARFRLVSAYTGAPLALTGFTGVAEIFPAPGQGAEQTLDVAVDQSASGGATTGLVTVSLAMAQTTTGYPADAFWALTLTDGAITKTVAAGPWHLTSAVAWNVPDPCGGLFGCFGTPGVPGCDAATHAACGSATHLRLRLPLPIPGDCSC